MQRVEVYGYSDDNIEVDGDFREEYPAYDVTKYIHFSDGSVVKGGFCIEEGKGWSFEAVKVGVGTEVERLEPRIEDGEHYTDRIRLVMKNCEKVTAKCYGSLGGPSASDIAQFWENFDTSDHLDEDLEKAYYILTE